MCFYVLFQTSSGGDSLCLHDHWPSVCDWLKYIAYLLKYRFSIFRTSFYSVRNSFRWSSGVFCSMKLECCLRTTHAHLLQHMRYMVLQSHSCSSPISHHVLLRVQFEDHFCIDLLCYSFPGNVLSMYAGLQVYNQCRGIYSFPYFIYFSHYHLWWVVLYCIFCLQHYERFVSTLFQLVHRNPITNEDWCISCLSIESITVWHDTLNFVV